jgi:hypothetical protein
MRRISILMVLLSLALVPATAFADNTTCANAQFLFMGVGRSQSYASSQDRYYKVRVVAGRSYSVYTWAPFIDASVATSSFGHSFFSDAACATSATTVSSGAKEPTVDVSGHSGDNDTIIPTFTGTMWIAVSNAGSATATAFTAIQETTLFSPWWFVGGTNQAFAEIKNATNASVAYTLTAYRANGTVCGTSSGSLFGNGNTAVSIGTLGTCLAAVSGSADIAFQGPPGSIVANITTIDGVQGTSFDAAFTPRMPWAISTQ